MSTSVRVAVLECDEPVGRTKEKYGTVGHELCEYSSDIRGDQRRPWPASTFTPGDFDISQKTRNSSILTLVSLRVRELFKMGKTFLDLPPEVQTAVVSWVLRPSDIAQLCLVSRQFHDVAMPPLYHSMYFNVDHWKPEHLEQFLTRGHGGHQYVRSLDVDSEHLEGEESARKLAKDVLQVLPRNCLTSFRCPLETGTDNDLMILLSSTQNNLSFLSLGPLMENALNVPESLRPWPRRIKTLVIPWKINIMTDISFYQQLIERSGNSLGALTIRSDMFTTSNSATEPNLKRLCSSEFLARSLLKHILCVPRHLRPPLLEISDINLQNQDLSKTRGTWCDAIDFTKLRTLQLWNCINVDTLLSELIALVAEQPMRLHGLVLSFEEWSQRPRLAGDFIQRLSGLKYLNICYPSELKDQPMVSGPYRLYLKNGHKTSIKDLYWGVGANNQRDRASKALAEPPREDIEALCQDCVNLRQLAIAMPLLIARHALESRWGEFGLYLDLLASLPKLKTFRILTWPIIHDEEYLAFSNSPSCRVLKKRIYLKYLDIIATSIVRRFSLVRAQLQRKHPENEYQSLSVLIFGNAEQRDMISRTEGYQDHWRFGPISYKVRRKETGFGLVTKAKRIDSRLMEYEEPIAYVVDEDTDQGLSLEAYSWGS